MSWKYVNPGYGELFNANHPKTYKSSTFNRVNGVSIREMNLGALQTFPSTHEIWLKFSLYTESITTDYYNNDWLQFYISNTDSLRCGLRIKNNNTIILMNKNQQVAIKDVDFSFNKSVDYSIVLHIKSDSLNGIIEVFIDEQPLLSYTGNVNDGVAMDTLYYFNYTGWAGSSKDDTSHFVSNVIIADYDISQEKLITCSLTDLTGTWDGIADNTLKATEVNQILTQKVNVDKLQSAIQESNNPNVITGITIAASGIRYDAEKVNALQISIKSATSELFTDTQSIQSNNTLLPTTYIKNIAIDVLANMTLNLTSVKQ